MRVIKSEFMWHLCNEKKNQFFHTFSFSPSISLNKKKNFYFHLEIFVRKKARLYNEKKTSRRNKINSWVQKCFYFCFFTTVNKEWCRDDGWRAELQNFEVFTKKVLKVFKSFHKPRVSSSFPNSVAGPSSNNHRRKSSNFKCSSSSKREKCSQTRWLEN